MEWTHLACLLAGTFVGSFLMTVLQNERRYRREREATEMYCDMFNRGRWFPPATQPPPPAPPAPPEAT
jgi:hypothetical protein